MSNKTLVFVDDEDIWRQAPAQILAELGAEVRTAATPDEAIAIFAQVKARLVLLDQDLGAHMSGSDLCQVLRDTYNGGSIVIAVTSSALATDRQAFIDAKADGVLLKHNLLAAKDGLMELANTGTISVPNAQPFEFLTTRVVAQ